MGPVFFLLNIALFERMFINYVLEITIHSNLQIPYNAIIRSDWLFLINDDYENQVGILVRDHGRSKFML